MADDPDRLELGEPLPHSDQAGAAAGWIENDVRHGPAKLLGKLKSHRFLALNPIRLLQRRDVEPTDLGLALGDKLAAIVDQSVDAIHRRALQPDLADIHFRRILGTEDRGFDAGMARIGGERRPGIAVSRHGHVFDTECLGHRHRHDQSARFERTGRQAALVLHQNLAPAQFCRELRQRQERRHGFAETHDVLHAPHRQQFAITPEIGRTGGELVLAHRSFHAVKIVADQERLAGPREVMDFISRMPHPGRRAFEVGDEGRPFSRQVVVVSQGRSPAREAMPMRLVVLRPRARLGKSPCAGSLRGTGARWTMTLSSLKIIS